MNLGCIDPIVEHLEPRMQKSIVMDSASSKDKSKTGNPQPKSGIIEIENDDRNNSVSRNVQ